MHEFKTTFSSVELVKNKLRCQMPDNTRVFAASILPMKLCRHMIYVIFIKCG